MTGSQVTTVISGMVCPSDGNTPGRGANGGATAFQANYAVCAGGITWSGSTPTRVDTSTTTTGGMFSRDSNTRMASVTDGLSNTLMASEGIIRPNGVGAWGELGGVWGGAPHGAYAFSAFEVPNTTVPDRVYSCKSTTIPGVPCENGFAGGLAGRWNFARSRHTNGVNAAMGDGSVKFFPNTINRLTWQTLGTMADGLVSGNF
jgi:prepilin-type processing-associated H-X9-DG protein